MSLCFKCNKSIKPASLATTVAGERYHPTCINCAICDQPLWGKPFRKNKDKMLVCDQPCQPQARPMSAQKQTRPPSAQRQQQLILEQNTSSNLSFQNSTNNLEMYKKPVLDTNLPANSDMRNKTCHDCNQVLVSKRFVTYENGVTICQDCEDHLRKPAIPRVKSAHFIACTNCNKIVQGSKFITEKNGDIVCENCDKSGPKCDKCNLLLKQNDVIRRLNFDVKFHDHCFGCKICKTHIPGQNFYEDETKKYPICQNCFEVSKLPKCSSCDNPINGPHLIIENKPIHDSCFKCNNCNKVLDKETGYYKDKKTDKQLCFDCNLKLNGVKCFKCGNVIEKEGLTFSDKDYHQHCFNCDSCGTDLTKMKKTLTDKEGNSLFCEPCFIQKFSPRCNKCNEPISPYLPGTVYEDKNYHKECFACARCKRTLANKKFFKSGNILICENCF